MNRKASNPINNINQILVHSKNFSVHKKKLIESKSVIDDGRSGKRALNNKKLLEQRSRYVQAVQDLKSEQLDASNRKISKILTNVHNKQGSTKLMKKKMREENQQSITSRSFHNILESKQRQRVAKNNKIDEENRKLSSRLSSSRFKDKISSETYYKQKTQIKKDLNVMSTFSKRSQSVMENLVFKNLDINPEHVPFLPQLSHQFKSTHLKSASGKWIKTNTRLFKSPANIRSKFHKNQISWKRVSNSNFQF